MPPVREDGLFLTGAIREFIEFIGEWLVMTDTGRPVLCELVSGEPPEVRSHHQLVCRGELTSTGKLLPFAGAVVAPGLVAAADRLLEPLAHRQVAPGQPPRRVPRDPVQERPQYLRRAQPHVLVRLVDQQLC